MALSASSSHGVDYYGLLEVSRDAKPEDVRQAYRRMALRWHPDKNPNIRELASKRFKLVSEAYQVLGDESKRIEYNRTHSRKTDLCGGRSSKFKTSGPRQLFTFTKRNAEDIFFEVFGKFKKQSTKNVKPKKPTTSRKTPMTDERRTFSAPRYPPFKAASERACPEPQYGSLFNLRAGTRVIDKTTMASGSVRQSGGAASTVPTNRGFGSRGPEPQSPEHKGPRPRGSLIPAAETTSAPCRNFLRSESIFSFELPKRNSLPSVHGQGRRSDPATEKTNLKLKPQVTLERKERIPAEHQDHARISSGSAQGKPRNEQQQQLPSQRQHQSPHPTPSSSSLIMSIRYLMARTGSGITKLCVIL